MNYERFHKATSSQRKVIEGDNFTYHIITEVLDRYLPYHNHILDIGCGAGTISLYMASKGKITHGIDVSKKAIITCVKSAKNLKLNNVTFEVLQFPDKVPSKKYDLITCIEVIEHIEKDRLALKKIFQLLRKNGVAILSTPSQNAPLYRLGLASEFDKRVGHLRRYTIEELEELAKKIGFEVIETKKTEGIIRNFLFLNPIAGKFIRFIKLFLVDVVTFLDEITLKLFGESDLFIVLKKP